MTSVDRLSVQRETRPGNSGTELLQRYAEQLRKELDVIERQLRGEQAPADSAQRG